MQVSLFSRDGADLRKLIKIATPILLAQIAQNSMGLVDTIMAGRVSATDMAAIAVGASIWLPLVLFGHGILLALPPTVAYLNGSGQRHKIAHQVRQGLWLAMLCCIPIGLLIYFSDGVLGYMQMDAKMASITTEYLHAMLWGLPGYLLLINFRCLNDGIAKTKPAMVITFCGLLVNIPLNYVLIYGKLGLPAFGAVGCGIATAIVNWLMALMMLLYSYKNHSERSLKVFSPLFEAPDRATIGKLFKLGFPIGVALSSEVALFALSSLLLSPLGAEVVASHQIALNVSSIMFMFPMSIGMACTILVSQALGAKEIQHAKEISYSGLFIGLLIAAVMAAILILWGDFIASIFVKEPQVIALASGLLIITALYQFSDSTQVVVCGILRGYKDTKTILWITLFSYWGLGIPIGYCLSRTDWLMPSIGAKGFWVAFIIALSVAAGLLFWRMWKLQSQSDEAAIARLEKLK